MLGSAAMVLSFDTQHPHEESARHLFGHHDAQIEGVAQSEAARRPGPSRRWRPGRRRAVRADLFGLERSVTGDQPASTQRDRRIDHPSVEGERAASRFNGFVVGLHDPRRIGHFFGSGRELFVQNRHLARMDAARAEKSESARTPDHPAKGIGIVECAQGSREPERKRCRPTGQIAFVCRAVDRDSCRIQALRDAFGRSSAR